MRNAFPAIVLLIFLWPANAFAETAYVTDNLRLGLHQASNTSDRAFRTLESGQEVEIISRDRNYANVRLPDGVVGVVQFDAIEACGKGVFCGVTEEPRQCLWQFLNVREVGVPDTFPISAEEVFELALAQNTSQRLFIQTLQIRAHFFFGA